MSYPCNTNLVNDTLLLFAIEDAEGVDSVQKTGLSLGTGNDVLLAFDIPNSHLPDHQTVENDVTVYVDGTPADPDDYTFSEGTGTGGRDQIIFDDPPGDGDVLTIDCKQGIPLLIADATLTVNSNPITRGAYPGGGSPLPDMPGMITAEFSFQTEVKGSAVAVDRPPNWGHLLKCVGFSETINAAANVTYQTGVCAYSSTIYFYRGGSRLEIATGVRLSPTFEFPAGDIPRISWSGAGRFAQPVDKDLASGLTFDDHRPPICENMELTLGATGVTTAVDNVAGYSAVATDIVVDDASVFAVGDIVNPAGSLEIVKVTAIDNDTETITVIRGYFGTTASPMVDDQGLLQLFSTAVCPTFNMETADNTTPRMDVNSPRGLKSNLWAGRQPTATLDLDQFPLAEKNYFIALESSDKQMFAWRLDGGSTNRVEFFAPAARVTGVQTNEGDSRWVDQVSVGLGQEVINDELRITCR